MGPHTTANNNSDSNDNTSGCVFADSRDKFRVVHPASLAGIPCEGSPKLTSPLRNVKAELLRKCTYYFKIPPLTFSYCVHQAQWQRSDDAFK